MSEGIPYADIIILALVAVFILLRLRGVLGQKMGHDDPNYFRRDAAVVKEREQPIVQVSEKLLKPKAKEEVDTAFAAIEDTQIKDTIAAIKAKDPQFSVDVFMGGAKLAFEMVFDAFLKGDKDTLKMLLSDEIFNHFASEVDSRNKEPNYTETTLVSVKAERLAHAELKGTVARLTVLFASEQIILVRDTKSEVIQGDPSHVQLAKDEWVFERDLTWKHPNWKIIET